MLRYGSPLASFLAVQWHEGQQVISVVAHEFFFFPLSLLHPVSVTADPNNSLPCGPEDGMLQ